MTRRSAFIRSTRRLAAIAAAAIFACAASAATAAPGSGVTLRGAKMAEMRVGETRALYLIIENNSAIDDRLLRVASSKFAQALMLSWKRRPIETLDLPAGEARALGPRGDALLILGAPHGAWLEGEEATLEFVFERAGRVSLPLHAGPRPSDGFAFTRSERTFPPPGASDGGPTGGGGAAHRGPIRRGPTE